MTADATHSSAPGPLPVLPTVFDSSGKILLEALGPQLEFAIQCGIRLVCLPAFGSEFYKLADNERERLIRAAIDGANGRIGVVVQCNHVYSPWAANLAKQAEELGASMIATALPRNLPASDDALRSHAETVAQATSLPVILQDWNPAGASISAKDVARVAETCSNLAFLKLEEPAIADKCAAIRTLTKNRVRVLSGWGGLYLQEQLDAGIAGVMPGLPLLDVFQAIWRAHLKGDAARVYRLHALLLPYIQFSLRNLEWFHHCEKALAKQRGLLPNGHVRSPTISLAAPERSYLARLIDRLLDALTEEGFSRQPLRSTSS